MSCEPPRRPWPIPSRWPNPPAPSRARLYALRCTQAAQFDISGSNDWRLTNPVFDVIPPAADLAKGGEWAIKRAFPAGLEAHQHHRLGQRSHAVGYRRRRERHQHRHRSVRNALHHQDELQRRQRRAAEAAEADAGVRRGAQRAEGIRRRAQAVHRRSASTSTWTSTRATARARRSSSTSRCDSASARARTSESISASASSTASLKSTADWRPP